MTIQQLISLLLAFVTVSFAFVSRSSNAMQGRSVAVDSSSSVLMVPRFDKSSQKWFPENEKDMEGGYDPIGSLIRQGPVPFFKRVTDPELYEQMVLKYQAG